LQNASIAADGLYLSETGLELNELDTAIESEADNYQATFAGNIIPSSLVINDKLIGQVYHGTLGSSFQTLMEKDRVKV
mgnify:CR=1